MKTTSLVISCEHGGNVIPQKYQYLFETQGSVLDSHRGFDIGALDIAEHLHESFDCDFIKNTCSRLLIDCNRRLANPNCFSEFTKSLAKEDKEEIIKKYYLPYRSRVEDVIKQHIEQGRQVLHLSIHTFTPELNGVKRNAAISILYDSRRHAEKEVARIWQNLILHRPPDFNVRLNYPYLGRSDGFTSFLRKYYNEKEYLGLEVESNQRLMEQPHLFRQLTKTLSESLKELLQML